MNALNSFQSVLENSVIAGHKSEFLSRGYILNNEYGRTAELNTVVGWRVVDFNLLCAQIGRHKDPTPTMITLEV